MTTPTPPDSARVMTHGERRLRRRDIALSVKARIPVDEIMGHHGVCYHTVAVACDEHGVPRPSKPSVATKGRPGRVFEVLASMIHEPETTDSARARAFQLTRQAIGAIRSRARKAGIVS